MRSRTPQWVQQVFLFLLTSSLLAFPLTGTLHAQEITGNWQGTVGGKLRVVLQIAQNPDGKLQGNLYSIDQAADPFPLTTISFTSPVLKLSIDMIHLSYEGRLSADGKNITGTVSQGKDTPVVLERATPETAWKLDSSPHTVQMVPVEKGVNLEVLDWGGSGRPLVLLTGLGDTAHVFDKFALKLTTSYHVYGITRRGFGASSAPTPNATNYTADRLGEDVLAVLDALQLNKPVLAGHSIAGEELSYIGVHHPENVAGLIYMDAGYPYALYDQVNGSLMIDPVELSRQLNQFAVSSPLDKVKDYDSLLANLQLVEKEIKDQQQATAGMSSSRPAPPANPIPIAIRSGVERFTTIHAPVLAVFAVQKDIKPLFRNDLKDLPTAQAISDRMTEQQAVAFERQVPSAHVVRIPHATHYVYFSNEADVLREINTFAATLPPAN